MKYILTDGASGVLATPQPQVIRSALTVTFEEAPLCSVAVVESSSKIYRNIKDGKCDIPASALRGAVKLSVMVPDGTAFPRKWNCDGLVGERLDDGKVLVYPDYSDALAKVSELRLELEALKREVKSDIAEMKKQIDESGGYDTF